MAHPFERIFDKALRVSTEENNRVLYEAEKLLEKGYSFSEIEGVLQKLSNSLIDSEEAEITKKALEELRETY